MLTPAPRAPTDRSSFCVFLRLFAACRAVGLAKAGLFPDSLPLSVFVSSADVAKGGDGAKSALCEIFLRLLLRVDSRFLFAALPDHSRSAANHLSCLTAKHPS